MAAHEPADGFGNRDVTAGPNAHPGILSGRKLDIIGQAGNTVAAHVSNQGCGTVALPALAAGAEGTVTITDSLISATSFIFAEVRQGTTTPGAGAKAAIQHSMRAPGTGSVIVDLHNVGSAATLSTDYQLWYWVVGN